MPRRIALLVLLSLFLGATALLLAGRPGGTGTARAADGPGLVVSLRVARLRLPTGAALPTTLEVANAADPATTIAIGCDPANDLKVFDSTGQLVWQLHPTCTAVTASLTLAGGERRTWSATWPGTLADGSAAPPGDYRLYGILHALPMAAVVGPVTIEVTRAEDATPTSTTRPAEVTRTPTVRPPEVTPTPATSGVAFPVADGDGRQVRPDVAGNPELGDCQNLVVWWDETAHKVYGRFVEPVWRSEPFLISGESEAVGPAKVAMNTGRRRWLVVWTAASDAGPTVIHGRYVDCGANALEGNVFRIGLGGDAAPVGDDQPAVADQGDGWVAVWRRPLADGGHAIVGGRVAGFTTSGLKTISDPAVAAVSEAAIDCETRAGCLVAWTQYDGAPVPRDVVGRQWWPGEETVGASLLSIATTDRNEHYPSVAWNGTYDRAAYAVTWSDDLANEVVMARTVVRGDPAQPNVYVLGPVVTVQATAGIEAHGDVAALGPDFVVVWAGWVAGTSERDVSARRLRYSPDARDLTPEAVVLVSDAPGRELYPAVASARDPLTLAVWQIERDGGGADVLGRHVALATSPVTLVGSVASGGTALQQVGPLRVAVRRLLKGQFACPEALVDIQAGAVLTPPRTGELVALRALLAPDRGPCALLVGPAGTYLTRGQQLQAHLPFGMAH
jgi:hypothetical protein